MIRFGTTTLSLLGWTANPQQAEASRALRLRAIRQIVESYGLQVVELTLDLHAVYPQVFDQGYYESVADLQQSLGFVCTVHLPFLWVELASPNEPIRQASLACLRQATKITQAIEVHTYVAHLWGLTTMQILSQLRAPAEREVLLGGLISQASRSLEALCDLVDPADLCVENLEDSLFEQALPIISQHGASICLDVGHLALQGSSALSFLEEQREAVREIHLHDAIVPLEAEGQPAHDHLALGEGHVDYAALLEKLADLSYDGPVILEVNSQADLQRSLDRISAVQ